MIKKNQTRLNQLHVLIDVLIIIISYTLAWYFVFESSWSSEMGGYSKEFYFSMLMYFVPGLLFLYWMMKVYAPMRVQELRFEVWNLLKANVLAVMIFSIIQYLLKTRLLDFSRTLLAAFFTLNFIFTVVYRIILRRILRRMRAKGYNQKHIIMIGFSRAAYGYIDRVIANPDWGYQIRGILDDQTDRGSEYRGIKVIGSINNLQMILEQSQLDEIVITINIREYGRLEEIVATCEKSGVHTKFIPDYNNVIPTRPCTEDFQGLPVIHIRNVPLSDSFNAMLKRVVDISGAAIAIIVFSPIMLLTAIGVRLSSPGPIVFKQERVGLHNRPFNMYKFRSMRVQNIGEEKLKWTTRGDNRITNFGKFIRKTSIDEFPQFFNVIKGDMSLVGPRPERPFFVEKFREEIPRYMIKHQVRPGITGWAQVNGYRGDTSIIKRVEYDLYYIENWTLGFDFKILFLTFFKGFINKNAY